MRWQKINLTRENGRHLGVLKTSRDDIALCGVLWLPGWFLEQILKAAFFFDFPHWGKKKECELRDGFDVVLVLFEVVHLSWQVLTKENGLVVTAEADPNSKAVGRKMVSF